MLKHEHGENHYSITKNRLSKLDLAFPDLDEVKNIEKEFRAVIGGSNASANWAALKAIRSFSVKQGKQLENETVLQNLSNEEKLDLVKQLNKDDYKNNNVSNYVLIIDEINRGNVSQIFGELITLIEDDKRAGKPESLEVILPYSKDTFSVPPNLYIVGTMNTADRSVEALDTALRRRFVFEEMPSKPSLLSPTRIFWQLLWEYKEFDWEDENYRSKENALYSLFGPGQKKWEDRKEIWEKKFINHPPDFNFQGPLLDGFFDTNGLNLMTLLQTINSRIEVLLSKDHQIGHSYFMKVYSEEDLKTAFYKSIIPLLQEYFYGDYGKIGLVLGKKFIETVNNTESTGFADFDYDGSDQLLEKVVYRIIDYREKGKEGFLDAVKAIYK
jgi:5-methylcytosine-specific restriction protein B